MRIRDWSSDGCASDLCATPVFLLACPWGIRMIFFEPGRHLDEGFRHDPFKAVVSPRPIGWISTVDAEGRTNLAPYSFFNAMAFLPPVVVFGTGTKADGSRSEEHRLNSSH